MTSIVLYLGISTLKILHLLTTNMQYLHKNGFTQRLFFPRRVTDTTPTSIDQVLYNERVNSIEYCFTFPRITDHYAIKRSSDWSTKKLSQNMTIRWYTSLNNVNALNDFQNLLASTITSFHYGDCPSECRKKNLIKIIQEVMDKKAVMERKNKK